MCFKCLTYLALLVCKGTIATHAAYPFNIKFLSQSLDLFKSEYLFHILFFATFVQ